MPYRHSASMLTFSCTLTHAHRLTSQGRAEAHLSTRIGSPLIHTGSPTHAHWLTCPHTQAYLFMHTGSPLIHTGSPLIHTGSPHAHWLTSPRVQAHLLMHTGSPTHAHRLTSPPRRGSPPHRAQAHLPTAQRLTFSCTLAPLLMRTGSPSHAHWLTYPCA